MSGRTRVLVVGVVLALVAALVAGALLWRQNDRLAEVDRLAQAETEATRAAAAIAVEMTSYDHETVEEDFAWIEEDGTSGFQETFSESTEPIRELIVRTRATAEGTVTDAAGTAEDADHVEVLLFVDQVLEREGDEESSVDSSRVVMQMVRQGDRWLVDDVELR